MVSQHLMSLMASVSEGFTLENEMLMNNIDIATPEYVA